MVSIYSISCELCTVCFVLFCWNYIFLSELIWLIHQCSSGLLHWHCGIHTWCEHTQNYKNMNKTNINENFCYQGEDMFHLCFKMLNSPIRSEMVISSNLIITRGPSLSHWKVLTKSCMNLKYNSIIYEWSNPSVNHCRQLCGNPVSKLAEQISQIKVTDQLRFKI